MRIQRAQIRNEILEEERLLLEAERLGAAMREGPRIIEKDNAPVAGTILFSCPEIGPEQLTLVEMERNISNYLIELHSNDPLKASILMIRTLNKNKEKVKTCVDTLVHYLDNIINNPNEEKFQKIRRNNKIFQERVACLTGTSEFLTAVGFSLQNLPYHTFKVSFWALEQSLAKDAERLQVIKNSLLNSKPILPTLLRNITVFRSLNSVPKLIIPDEFYDAQPTELKEEQKRIEEQNEKDSILRTRELRERDKEVRRYRFTLIRIRFPDGVILQGVFKTRETMATVYEFLSENLQNDWLPFQLCSATGKILNNDTTTLGSLSLSPAAMLHFSWDSTVFKSVSEKHFESISKVYLIKERMDTIADIPFEEQVPWVKEYETYGFKHRAKNIFSQTLRTIFFAIVLAFVLKIIVISILQHKKSFISKLSFIHLFSFAFFVVLSGSYILRELIDFLRLIFMFKRHWILGLLLVYFSMNYKYYFYSLNNVCFMVVSLYILNIVLKFIFMSKRNFILGLLLVYFFMNFQWYFYNFNNACIMVLSLYIINLAFS